MHPFEDELMPEGDEAPPPGVEIMKIVRWILLGGMAILAIYSVTHYIGSKRPKWVQSVGGNVEVSPSQKVQYHCSMHPTIIQDQPGDCPICGMTLVPIKENPHQGHETAVEDHASHPSSETEEQDQKNLAKDLTPPALIPVMLSRERTQKIGVKTATATRKMQSGQIRTTGVVVADESRVAHIHPRFSGWIEKLFLNETGQKVNQGDPLATIYSEELYRIEQEYLNGLKWKNTSKDSQNLSGALIQSARERLQLLGISPQEIEEIEKSGKPQSAIVLRSPVTGYVLQKEAFPGLYFQPGTTLFTIADLSMVWVLVDIYEQDIAKVQLGQKATLSTISWPDILFEGKIVFLYPMMESQTRTLQARLEFKNRDLRLRPGFYGDVKIEIDPAQRLLIPVDALIDTGKSQYVFVSKAEGRFEPRLVKTGIRLEDEIEVTSGLKPEEAVVTSANFLIDSESRIQAAIQGMTQNRDDIPIDKEKYPNEWAAWKRCEQEHKGMGSMEEDCKKAILNALSMGAN